MESKSDKIKRGKNLGFFLHKKEQFYRRLLLDWTIAKIILGLLSIPIVMAIFYLIQHFTLTDLVGPASLLAFALAQALLDNQSEKNEVPNERKMPTGRGKRGQASFRFQIFLKTCLSPFLAPFFRLHACPLSSGSPFLQAYFLHRSVRSWRWQPLNVNTNPVAASAG
jgi:hypothetical protein